eukprot:m.175478 g.175478  ORF g.175478 m.175478 type:complete len:77 (-) comp53318_c0_seq5:10-240(-)
MWYTMLASKTETLLMPILTTLSTQTQKQMTTTPSTAMERVLRFLVVVFLDAVVVCFLAVVDVLELLEAVENGRWFL